MNNIFDEWSEIPPWRRHSYFYLGLLLVALAANALRDVIPALFPSRPVPTETLHQAIRLGDESSAQMVVSALGLHSGSNGTAPR
jgi:hypothetical protein